MRKTHWYGLTLIGFALVAASSGNPASVEHPAAGLVPHLNDSQIRDLDIEFYRGRIARDRRSAGDYTSLAGLYLQRARQTADNQDLVRAEEIARRSLALRTGRNSAAYGVLASSLMAQHRFPEALAAARRLLDSDSSSVAARAIVAEAELELGRYEEAGRMIGSLIMYRNDLSVAPRLARWEELQGRPERARQLLRQARDEAAHRHGLPQEQLAWFQLRLGDLALRYGRLGEAERELRAGLDLAPADHRLLGALSRLELNRHHWDQSIAAGEQAIGFALDPATLGVLSDAYAAKGDTARAAEYARVIEVTISHQPGPYHRAWSLFLLDHRREVDLVLEQARKDLETRKDIYGYDLLAWALHQAGLHADAREMMQRALALGTRDASLLYHAGAIERALGNDGAARGFLEAALETNPRWHPFQPAAAQASLDSIARHR